MLCYGVTGVFFFQAEDGIRDIGVTGVQTCALPISDLDEFVACYHPENRHERTPTWSDANPEGHWRAFTYDELLQRDKVSLDIFWLRDESLEDSASLADPDVIAAEIVEDLRAALEEFEAIGAELAAPAGTGGAED